MYCQDLQVKNNVWKKFVDIKLGTKFTFAAPC